MEEVLRRRKWLTLLNAAEVKYSTEREIGQWVWQQSDWSQESI